MSVVITRSNRNYNHQSSMRNILKCEQTPKGMSNKNGKYLIGRGKIFCTRCKSFKLKEEMVGNVKTKKNNMMCQYCCERIELFIRVAQNRVKKELSIFTE